MTKQFKLLILITVTPLFTILGQVNTGAITTALPFLQVAADARAAGLADQGAATSPDVFSQQWNSSKYAFIENDFGVGVSVTPYLTDLVDDIILANLAGYKKISERGTIGVGFRFFSLGEIEFTNDTGNVTATENPNELSLDVSYSLKLSEHFSMSVAGRYLRSDLRLQNANIAADANAGNGFGVDISGYYVSDERPYGDFDGRWRGGFAITNIGPKISYSAGEESFIPTNLRIAGGFDFVIDAFNEIRTSVEFSKLLVPSDSSDTDQSAIGSIFSSFGDAEDGFSEELREVTFSIGAEYVYNDVFSLRAGYFNEHEDKGARRFFSLGAGFKYTSLNLDVSYLFSTSNVPSPLEGTLRFGLSFNFGDQYAY